MNASEHQQCEAHFAVLKIDETKYWSEDIQAKAGRLFGVYLFDRNRAAHCCEVTPSYECHFVEDQWENRPESLEEQDRLHEAIRGASESVDPLRYFHCRVLDALPKVPRGSLPPAGQWAAVCELERAVIPEDEDYDDHLERVFESLRENQV